MMYWGHGMSGWGYLAMAATTLVFLGVLVTVVALLVRYVSGPQRSSSQWPTNQPSAVDPQHVLAERFARGEIDEQEYMTRLATLRAIGTAQPSDRTGG